MKLKMKQRVADIIKWSATLTLIAGSLVNGSGHTLGPYMLMAGAVLWLLVALWWRETALVVTNTAMILATAIGLWIGAGT